MLIPAVMRATVKSRNAILKPVMCYNQNEMKQFGSLAIIPGWYPTTSWTFVHSTNKQSYTISFINFRGSDCSPCGPLRQPVAWSDMSLWPKETHFRHIVSMRWISLNCSNGDQRITGGKRYMIGCFTLSCSDCKQYTLFTIGGVGCSSSNSSHNRTRLVLHWGGRRWHHKDIAKEKLPQDRTHTRLNCSSSSSCFMYSKLTDIYCVTVTLSYCHTVILSHSLSYCHTILLSYCLSVTLSYCLTVTLSFCLLSYCLLSYCHWGHVLLSQSLSHSHTVYCHTYCHTLNIVLSHQYYCNTEP